MMYQHRNQAEGHWLELTFFEQMANVGAEIGRTISWKVRNEQDFSLRAFERALELLDLTIRDRKNRKRVRELCRVREMLADHFAFDNIYRSTDDSWEHYFYAFQYAAACRREKARLDSNAEQSPDGLRSS